MTAIEDAPVKQAKPKRPQVPWNPWVAVVFVVAVFYTAQIIAGLLVYIYPALKHWSSQQSLDWLNDSIIAQFAYGLLAAALIISTIHFFLKRYNSTFRTIGLKRPRPRDFLYGLIAAPPYYLLYVLSVGAVSAVVVGFNVDQQQQIGFDHVHGAGPLILAFISLVIIPPIMEEIAVRGFLYSSLKKALPIGWAVFLTSLIFASAHLPEGGAAGPLYIAALDTFVLSLVLIYLREKTGSLWAGITLHAIKNCVAFVLLFIIGSR